MDIRLEKVVPLPIKEVIPEKHILWNSDFVFDAGGFYQISAPSGIGKTTLLSIIYGIRKDFDGSFFIDKKEVRHISNYQWSVVRSTKLSMVFQGLNLFENLTVKENIAIKNQLTGFHSQEQILEMLSVLEIKNLLHKKIKEISYGQRQRVAIIRALCQPFEFLLLDEPFSHLDYEITQIAFKMLSKAAESQGAGIILTSLSSQPLSDKMRLIKL